MKYQLAIATLLLNSTLCISYAQPIFESPPSVPDLYEQSAFKTDKEYLAVREFMPRYPTKAYQDKITGYVVVQYTISKTCPEAL